MRVCQLFIPKDRRTKFPSKRNEALNDEVQTIFAVLTPPVAGQFYKFLTPQYNFTPHKLDSALTTRLIPTHLDIASDLLQF